MELGQYQKQVHILSPQMVQSMKILQMGIQELSEYIEEAIQENPVLEIPEPQASDTELGAATNARSPQDYEGLLEGAMTTDDVKTAE